MGKKREVGGFHTPFSKLSALKKPEPPPASPSKKAPPVAASVAVPSSSRKLTDEELFLQEVGFVAPIPAKVKKGERIAPPPVEPRARTSEDAEVMAELADLVSGD